MEGSAQQIVDFLQRNWKPILVALIIIILLWMFIRSPLFARLVGRDTGPDLRCRDYGTPFLTNAEQKSVATSVNNSLRGWNFRKGPVKNAFEKLLNLSLADLCKTHNVYKNRYAGTTHPTLRQLIEAEWITDGELESMRGTILTRLASLSA